MLERYDLAKMLEEIKEDEYFNREHRKGRVSQDDIKDLLKAKQKEMREEP